MAENQAASFIPKRNPSKKLKRAVTRRVYIFTFLSYVALFVVLILSGALYGYKLYLDNKLSDEISGLDQDIKSFKVADFERLVELDQRLELAESRFSNQISLSRLLSLIENSTVQTIQYDSISIQRDGDTQLTLTANILSNDFDSAIYQRDIYENTSELEGLTLNGVAFAIGGAVSSEQGPTINPRLGSASSVSGDTNASDGGPSVIMTANFTLTPGTFKVSAPALSQPTIISEPIPVAESLPEDDSATDSAGEVVEEQASEGNEVEVSNQNNL